MQPYPYTPGSLADLLTALSEPRFQTYLDRLAGIPNSGCASTCGTPQSPAASTALSTSLRSRFGTQYTTG